MGQVPAVNGGSAAGRSSTSRYLLDEDRPALATASQFAGSSAVGALHIRRSPQDDGRTEIVTHGHGLTALDRGGPDRERADRPGRAASTVYELMRAGQLESVHIGACRRVPAEAVHSFLLQLRTATSA